MFYDFSADNWLVNFLLELFLYASKVEFKANLYDCELNKMLQNFKTRMSLKKN